MQSVLDNLCRCFGTDGEGGDGNPSSSGGGGGSTPLETLCGPDSLALRNTSSTSKSNSSSKSSVPSTPDMKRRTRSLTLQDKQWDALFLRTPPPTTTTARNSSHSKKKRASGKKSSSSSSSPSSSDHALSHAHALAKAKLAATSAQRPTAKRKRQRAEDIFRSRQRQSSKRGGNTSTQAASSSRHRGTQPNPLSRFLSSHPVLTHALCFATPIDESSDTEGVGRGGGGGACGAVVANPFFERNNSLISENTDGDTNTLNTVGDDTVSSTVYYERTKLAGLQQTNPPMPLFSHYQVAAAGAGDEIHRIVESRSHSSTAAAAARAAAAGVVAAGCDWKQALQDMELAEEEEAGGPPPMTHSSSESTRSSVGARKHARHNEDADADGYGQEMEF